MDERERAKVLMVYYAQQILERAKAGGFPGAALTNYERALARYRRTFCEYGGEHDRSESCSHCMTFV